MKDYDLSLLELRKRKNMIYHFFAGQNFHLCPSIIKSIVENPGQDKEGKTLEHFFCINMTSKNRYFNIVNPYIPLFEQYKFCNYYFIEDTIEVFRIINSKKSVSNRFFFHSNFLDTKSRIALYIWLRIFNYSLLKRISLIGWGIRDFHVKGEKEGLKRSIISLIHQSTISKMRNLISLSQGDYLITKEYFPDSNCVQLNYIMDYSDNIVPIESTNNKIAIMISHSGWEHNNHLKTFNLISKYKNENIDIICPLAYGNKDYIKEVIRNGESIFGKKFKYFTNLKPKEEYIELISSIDIYMTSANIQTGIFAVIVALDAGKKIYITGNLLNSMDHKGFVTMDIETVKKMSFSHFSKPLTERDIRINRKAVKQHFKINDDLIKKWNEIYIN
jgi:hypothetical protein